MDTLLFFPIALIPLYLWAYGASKMQHRNDFLRGRFWMGIFSGFFSVGIVYAYHTFGKDLHTTHLLLLLFGVFLIFYGVVFLLTLLGSPFARGFLRKITLLHSAGIWILISGMLLLSRYAHTEWLLFLLPLFLSASFEETTKHLTTIGFLGKNFTFSLADISYFTFFVVIGFVFFENISFFITGNASIVTIVLRSIFSLAAHLFSALICTWFWWKALSYHFFSFSYIALFLGGFFVATLAHMGFNISLQEQWIVVPFVYVVATYILWIRMTIYVR